MLRLIFFIWTAFSWVFPLTFFNASISEASVPVTVNVTVDGQPADAMIRVLRENKLFQVEYTDVHTPGLAAFELPPGQYTLQVEHGARFTALPQRRDVRVEAGAPVELAVDIQRLIVPSAQGYYSADLHTHTIASAESTFRIFGIPNHGSTPVDQLVAVQLAADLDVMFISDHNSVSGHELFAQTAQARGAPYLLSEEITTVLWGHFNAYSLEPGRLVEFDFIKLPGRFFAEARANGAQMVQINHPLSTGFGYFFIQNQPQFDPSFDAVEVFNDHFEEDDAQTILRLFQFWNQGKRYVATAVSDDHDWKIMNTEYGTPRTYVHVGGTLSAQSFLDALQAGHAFVTYGPLIFVNAAGKIPGDALEATKGQTIQLDVLVQSVNALEGVQAELIRNGQKVQTVAVSGTDQAIAFAETADKDGWYVVRLLDGARRYLAMTNPIWVDVK